MRIAHFVQRYPPALGGSEAYFERLSRFLAASGDEVTVFTSNALDLEAFWNLRARTLPAGQTVQDGVRVVRYGLLRWPGRRWFLKPLSLIPWRYGQCLTLPCNPISLRMWADAGRFDRPFDLVHASAFPYAFPIACGLRLARRLRIPFCVTPFLHLGDLDDPRDRTRRQYTSPPLRYLLRQADRIFVQTEPEREALLSLGFAPEKHVLQGLGVDAADCTGGDRQQARRNWQVDHEEPVVGHLANLSAEKGSVDLLRAAQLAWQRGGQFRLVLAGPSMPNFRRYWDSYPCRDRVRCLGVLSDTAKRDFFAGIDLFGLPSRSDSFGLVLLEAWANGAANLAYRAGGPAGVIRHEEDGLLVRCGDVPALAEALLRLTGDAALRRRLGMSGQERCAREFRWSDKLELVRNVYTECISRHKADG
ncbi:MAG: glycosyltransferase family 4 protein [Planctomycetia bacterium]|nr:glycosyltransferase family 4 protein [Planctomycetia bacterium]